MVTLEAMAMAKPIVATDIDGINEQIKNGETGLLVPSGEPDALCKAIVDIVGKPEVAERLGVSARKRVQETFTVEKMVAETERVYKSLKKLDLGA